MQDFGGSPDIFFISLPISHNTADIDRFDIREFHDLVIEDGTVTLTMLEAKIGSWIKAAE